MPRRNTDPIAPTISDPSMAPLPTDAKRNRGNSRNSTRRTRSTPENNDSHRIDITDGDDDDGDGNGDDGGDDEYDDEKPKSKPKSKWTSKIAMLIIAVILVSVIVLVLYWNFWHNATPEKSAMTARPVTPSREHPRSHTHGHPPDDYNLDPEEKPKTGESKTGKRDWQRFVRPKSGSNKGMRSQHKLMDDDVNNRDDDILEPIPEESTDNIDNIDITDTAMPINGPDNAMSDNMRTKMAHELSQEIAREENNTGYAENEDEDEDDDENDTPLDCNFVLVSGKRKGHECTKQCKPGNTRCTNHINK